jgi:hypothetical protein
MHAGIITLPLRAGIGGARLALRTTGLAVGVATKVGGRATVAAVQAASRVSDVVAWGRPAPTFEPSSPEAAAPVVSDLRSVPSTPERAGTQSVNGAEAQTPSAPETDRPATQRPEEPATQAPAPEPEQPSQADLQAPAPEYRQAPQLESEPVHVSEEPELVQEVAEPGAEDGAGAAVHVAEPWQGYARMTAKQIIDRLADASPAELAAVQLYESIHRDRQTVRAAAERNLKSKTGRGSPD